jgi:hypothetical protein
MTDKPIVDGPTLTGFRLLAKALAEARVEGLDMQRQEDRSWRLTFTIEGGHRTEVVSQHAEPSDIGMVARDLEDEIGDALKMGFILAAHFNEDWFKHPGRQPA